MRNFLGLLTVIKAIDMPKYKLLIISKFIFMCPVFLQIALQFTKIVSFCN
ncbi:hypothetical protein BGP_0851 [Beggiatoa sp. PS]|nr:hypothetical protein BGP_0851 [Beggiatoa sp. PS]